MALQMCLQELGYYDKAIDPAFGPGTESGMRQFERLHKLRVNGIASAQDQKLLFSPDAHANTRGVRNAQPDTRQTAKPAGSPTVKVEANLSQEAQTPPSAGGRCAARGDR